MSLHGIPIVFLLPNRWRNNEAEAFNSPCNLYKKFYNVKCVRQHDTKLFYYMCLKYSWKELNKQIRKYEKQIYNKILNINKKHHVLCTTYLKSTIHEQSVYHSLKYDEDRTPRRNKFIVWTLILFIHMKIEALRSTMPATFFHLDCWLEVRISPLNFLCRSVQRHLVQAKSIKTVL